VGRGLGRRNPSLRAQRLSGRCGRIARWLMAGWGGMPRLSRTTTGGVAHTMVTPAALGPYKWAPDLERNVGPPTLATSVAKMSDAQASDIRARTYKKPALGGAAPQVLEVIGGRLRSTSPASSIGTLIHMYPSAHSVPAGPLGGSAACFEQTAGTADSVAMCAWFDNDSFGILTSPTLNAANLANLMVQDRPLIELVKK